MTDRNLGPFFTQLVGNSGVLLPEAGTPEKLYCNVLFRCYYRSAEKISKTVALKRINGQAPVSLPVWRYYAKDSAWAATCADMEHLVALCRSITRARIMQQRVHDWLPESGLPASVVMELERHYVPRARPDEISTYLAHVRHQLMNA